jgi:hypothetical protein
MSRFFFAVVDERTEKMIANGAIARPVEVSIEEGDFSPLRREYSRLKYNSHIVAICQELAVSKLFRHVPLEKVCALVADNAAIRTPSWPGHYRFTDYLNLVECEPRETITRVLIRSTLSCVVCDELSWAADDVLVDGDSGEEYTDRQYKYAALCGSQRDYARVILPGQWGAIAPVFCKDCYSAARRITRKVNPSYTHDAVRVLKALAGLLKREVKSQHMTAGVR